MRISLRGEYRDGAWVFEAPCAGLITGLAFDESGEPLLLMEAGAWPANRDIRDMIPDTMATMRDIAPQTKVVD
jgi:hypothetical protein